MGLDTVELVMAIEDHFELKIPDDATEQIQTVGDLTDYLMRRLLEDGRPTVRDVVHEQVCRITCEQAGTTMDKLTPGTSFIHDLGMD